MFWLAFVEIVLFCFGNLVGLVGCFVGLMADSLSGGRKHLLVLFIEFMLV